VPVVLLLLGCLRADCSRFRRLSSCLIVKQRSNLSFLFRCSMHLPPYFLNARSMFLSSSERSAASEADVDPSTDAAADALESLCVGKVSTDRYNLSSCLTAPFLENLPPACTNHDLGHRATSHSRGLPLNVEQCTMDILENTGHREKDKCVSSCLSLCPHGPVKSHRGTRHTLYRWLAQLKGKLFN